MSIPSTQPRVLFEADLPHAYSGGAHDLPVLAGEHLLCLGGGFGNSPRERTPVLVALDRLTGSERFRLEVPPGSFTGEISTSLVPTVRPDGVILLAVYQHDTALQVFALAPNGQVLWEDQPYAQDRDRLFDVRLQAGDSSIKLWLSPVIPGPEQTYLVSWLYRQDRFACLEYRRPDQCEALWSTPEWLVGACGDVVLGATVPRATSELSARDLATGQPRWSLPGRAWIVAAASPEWVLLVARPPTLDEALEALEAAEEPASSLANEYISNKSMTDHPSPPILALEPISGETLWSLAVPGYVVSLACGPAHMCAIAIAPTGRPHLLCANWQGQILWSQELPAVPNPPMAYWDETLPDKSDLWPVIVAVDTAHVLWETPDALICTSLREGKAVWQLADVPACRGFFPRMLDRILGRSTSLVQDGILYRRVGSKLWAYTDRTVPGTSVS